MEPKPQLTTPESAPRRHTLASRLIMLIIGIAIATTTMAYGTVHYWALAAFAISATAIVCLWCLDGLVLGSVQLSRNPLQLPLLGLILLGAVQLLPLRNPDNAGLPVSPVRTWSLDPYSTRFAIIQVTSLLVYFAATLIFTNTERRLRALTRTIIIFGFLLAVFGLIQYVTTDGTRVYWLRQLAQSQAFGPFINRHHFAGYMELTMSLPLGLLFSGAIEKQKLPLYIFATAMMGVALIMTNSRGGMISLAAEILLLVVVAGPSLARGHHESRATLTKAALIRAALAMALIAILIGGALLIGGSASFSRLLGTASSNDPTSGRTHFWSVTIDVIKANPMLGSGLGALGVIYTRFDSRNGLYRLEQAHNDYLQILADAGIVGGLLGLVFIVILFRKGLTQRETHNRFRRGLKLGALAGCFAVLIHSFFDFTLHTTANALLFLILAAFATEAHQISDSSHRRHRPRESSLSKVPPK